MIKRIGYLVLSVGLLIFLGGCWDNTELGTREIVTAVGIDYNNESKKFLVTYEYLIASRGDGGGAKGNQGSALAKVITLEADSVSEAFRILGRTTSKSTYMFKNRMVIVGEEVARRHMLSFANYFFRFNENESSVYLITVQGRASDIMSWKPKEALSLSEYIVDLLHTSNIMKNHRIPDFQRFRYISATDSKAFHTQSLELKKHQSGETTVSMGSISVFKKYDLVGFLNEAESKALRILDNELKIEEIVPPAEEPNRVVTYHIIKSKSKIIPRKTGDKMSIEIEVNCQGNIEQNSTELKLMSASDRNTLEKQIAETMLRDMNACIHTLKELKTDALGFGEAIYRKYPQEWGGLKDRWDEEFPDIAVTLRVKTDIKGVGLIIDKNEPGKEGY